MESTFRGSRGLLVRLLHLTAPALLGLTSAAPNAVSSPFERFAPVTEAMIEQPDPADWLMWRRTQNGWGFSPLDQIDTTNVGQLALVWTRPLAEGIQEATPLVHDGVMFVPNPDDLVQALDAENGELLWSYKRTWPEDLKTFIGTPGINRNLAILGTTLFDLTGDDHIIGLDALTGKLVWETPISDYRKLPAQQSSGPLIAAGKVVSGRGCQPKVGPEACAMTAHDPRTGKELWRTLTIPRPGEPGDESWGKVPFNERSHVGTWMIPSYDPALKLIYFGTSVTAPTPKFMLGGNDKQHLHHNSTLALEVETGKIRWHYQHVVDHWDLDHTFERLLVDTPVAPDAAQVPWINPRLKRGQERKVVTGVPGKTGIVYTLDRETGEFLWARPTVTQNVVTGIDGRTGRVTVNPATVFRGMDQRIEICPSFGGGRNFFASSYSPMTRAMYVPLFNTCAEEISSASGEGLTGVLGIRHSAKPVPGNDNIGTLHAISVQTGTTLWRYDQRAAITSVLATGGGLIFAGDSAGRFRAFDQRDGRILWEVNLGSTVSGYPIAFAVGGRQYIAVSTGFTLNTALLNRLTPDIKVAAASNLFVFALPGGVRAVAGAGVVRAKPVSVSASSSAQAARLARGTVSGSVWDGIYSTEQAERGFALYTEHCALCHGQQMNGVPGVPAVAGAGFLAGWDGKNTADLLDYLMATMPPNKLGSLSDRQMVDVLAAILQGNRFPSGSERLDETTVNARPRLISRRQ
jgi:PQQ-dependent dehydrogenase (methanol/ethanol family)